MFGDEIKDRDVSVLEKFAIESAKDDLGVLKRKLLEQKNQTLNNKRILEAELVIVKEKNSTVKENESFIR